MTMVSSGTISLAGTATSGALNESVEVELGGSGTSQISLNDSAARTLAAVPSGAISLSSFYGKSAFVPVNYTYTSGSGSLIIPTGCTKISITAQAVGGAGGNGDFTDNVGGGGGGSGGWVQKTITITAGDWGRTLSWLVGAGGINSTITGSGSFGSISLTAGFGAQGSNGSLGAGGPGGLGGSASGGDVNTAGNPGSAGDTSGNGGSGGNSPAGAIGGAPGANPGADPGAGGGGANAATGSGAGGGAETTFALT